MHVNRGMLGWGVFFIALGAVPLAVRSGTIDASTAARAWELWPLLLIGAGLGLALRGTSLASVGNIVVGLAFGLMAGGLVVGGIGSAPVTFCGTGSGGETAANNSSRAGTLVDGAKVDLQVDCGSLTASSQAGSDWSVAWPKGATNPRIQASDGSLRVEMGNQHGFAVGNSNASWTIGLPSDPAIDLSLAVNAGSAKLRQLQAHVTSASVSVNAGDARVDLTQVTGLRTVDGSVNAGSLSIALPAMSTQLSGNLSANAGNLRICTPPDVPLRIQMSDEPLGSNNFSQRGLTRSGDTWTRGVVGVGDGGISLEVSASLGTITLDPEDGCG